MQESDENNLKKLPNKKGSGNNMVVEELIKFSQKNADHSFMIPQWGSKDSGGLKSPKDPFTIRKQR